ncbi:MAG: radical SAM protein [Armatimonadetes bacterium]|nr:radical SAM protein [Armatimonadota bacterium]
MMRSLSKVSSFAGALFERKLHFEFEMVPLTVNRPSLPQLLALITTEAGRIFPRPSVSGLPSVLQLEPANVCNLSCPLCPSGRRALSRPLEMMPLDLFDQLMVELGGGLSLLILWGWGEPLLHPQLPEMIQSAKRYGTAVITSTNGQLMTSDLADRLVRSRLDAIIVAVDGATEETYRNYRVGGSLEKALGALDMIHEAKARRGSSTPLVNLRMVVTRSNEEEIPLMREIAIRHRADLLTFRGVSMTDLWDDEDDSRYVPCDSSRSLYRYAGGNRVKTGEYVCRRPWKRATVACDGSVVPCEMDYANSEAFGVFSADSSFARIWNGASARKFRRAFLRDRMQFEFCARCPFNDRVTEDSTLERYETKHDLFDNNLR